jgi:hypothetical protein
MIENTTTKTCALRSNLLTGSLRFAFKKFQADNVMKIMNSPEVEHFKKDKDAAKTPVKKYGTGDENGQAPKQSF